MPFRDTPIRQKLMIVMLLTSGAVSLLTCAGFVTYEVITLRKGMVRGLTTRAEIIAANSTAALAFQDVEDANDVLSALKADPRLVGACIYDNDGHVFASYPTNAPLDSFPSSPGKASHRFESSHLAVFRPIAEGDRTLGMVYLKSNLTALTDRYRAFTLLALVILAGSLVLAYLMSKALQKQISTPILALAGTAKAISNQRDYSVRATKTGKDELGLLTDAFNQMLTQIQEQNENLKQSEARVRAVLNAELSAVVVMDSSGKVTDWNARAEKMFGWSRREAIGQELAELMIPQRHREAHRNGMKRFLATGEGPVLNRLIEMSAARRDGSEFPVELSISSLRTGQAISFCGFITDITERKQAEKREAAFARLGQRLSAVTSAADAARIIADIAHELFGWDACSLDVYAPEEDTIYPVINVDTIDGRRVDVPPAYSGKAPSAMARKILEHGGQLILRQEPFDFSREAMPFGNIGRPSASLVYVPIRRGARTIGILSIQSYAPGAYNQQTLSTVQSLADQCGGALERVRAEENLRQLNEVLEHRVRERTIQLESARQELQDFIDGMSTLNAKVALDGTLLLVNKTAQLASGFTLEEILKLNFLESSWWTFDPQVQARVQEAFRKACQGETINYEERLFAFGRVIDISFSLVPVRGPDGRVAYIVAEGRDITTLKYVEQSLAERTRQLESVNKELEAFSYSVSHDLRAPLRHIDGFADMLRKESSSGLNASGQRFLQIISDAAKRMGALIDDLLVFSRMGRAEMRRGRVSMDQLVSETLHDLAQDLKGRTVIWDIDALPEVDGDRAMLKQVWMNLLSNAVKYTRHRERAAIKISSQPNGKEEWQFAVQDNGAGFDMQYADKLFGVFQRLHHAEEFEGTGVGLANVRRIVLRHGGRTWAEARVDAGATFYFTLPVHYKE